MYITRLLLLAVMTSLTTGHGVPIWELLPRQDKMGQILSMFVYLVDQTCAYAYIPDCHRVLTLHGLSNLVNMQEYTLNGLDPSQSDAQEVIWDQMTRGVWDLPHAYLPQGNYITNEIAPSYPTQPPQPQPFLYPYAPIPTTHNKPVAAVSNPHPYAVKVAPPPDFTPTIHDHDHDHQIDEMSDHDLDMTPEDRFADWSDSETIVGNQDAIQEEFEAWSRGDVVVGNQEPVQDIYASWSDADVIVSDQEVPDDRFTGWTDSGVLEVSPDVPEDAYVNWNAGMANGQNGDDIYANWNENELRNGNVQPETDRFANWNDAGMGHRQTEEDIYSNWNEREATHTNNEAGIDRFANWNDVGMANQETGDIYSNWNENEARHTDKQTEADRFANWNDVGMNNRHTEEDIYTSWSEIQPTDSDKQTETDRYASWSDSETELNKERESKLPVGILPTANFEPLMVESRVVVSRVPTPRARTLTQGQHTRRKGNAPPPTPLLPLLLLRK